MPLSPNVPDFLSPSTSPDLEYLYKQYLYERYLYELLGTPSDIRTVHGLTPDPFPSHAPGPWDPPVQLAPTVGDRATLCVGCSASTRLPLPAPQETTLPPPNWLRVPQKAYDHGRRQWDFIPSECVSFEVNGCPGVNIDDALRKRFTGLDGRDDQVLQDASSAISCWLSVRLT